MAQTEAWHSELPHRANGAHAQVLVEKFPAAKETEIPTREYVVSGYLQRGVLIELVGPGGGGKGQLALAWAVSLALGRAFGGFHPDRPRRVLFFSVEDDVDEQDRRVAALLRSFGAATDDLRGNLKLSTPGAEYTGLLFANGETAPNFSQDQSRPNETREQHLSRLFGEAEAPLRTTALLAELRHSMDRFQPDLLVLDPLAELHDVTENDNSALKLVGAELRRIARQRHIAVLLIHHTRKGAADPGNMDVGRGASSMVYLARKVFTLFPMTEDEAKGWEISTPDAYFRLDGAKANHDAKNATEWFQRVAVTLDNGDVVARCEPWTPPASGKVNDEMIAALLSVVKDGERGQPWSRQLGHYDRSIARSMKRLGITARPAQEAALEALFAKGVVEAAFVRPNRVKALGLRHPSGGPDVRWAD